MDVHNAQKGDVVEGKKASYEIIEEIGGGMTSSFLARDRDNARDVFLKIYVDEPRKSNEEFPRFQALQDEINKRLREIEAITEIFYEDFLIEDLFYCSAKEFVPGKSIKKIIEEDFAAMEARRKLGLASVFMGVLGQVHSKGLVHADLKPDNLFCRPDHTIDFGWQLKVIDFDFALVDGMEPFNVVGTAGYYSPEHLLEKRPERGSDVFTAGLILGRMLTSLYPLMLTDHVFEREDYLQAIRGRRFYPDAFETLRKEYKQGDRLAAMVEKMLEWEIAKRPSVEEVHDILVEAFKAEEGTSIPQICVLHCGSEKIIVFEDRKEFRRENFYRFGRDKAAYVSSREQFSIAKSADGWKIVGAAAAKNPTLLNGSELKGGEAPLKKDDLIQVGPMELKVSFQ